MGITKEQYDYILAHINDRPRTRVSRDAGVSMATVYKIVRMHGGEMRYDLCRKHNGIEKVVRCYYPTMTAREISEKFGYNYDTVNRWARKLGLKHNKECNERIKLAAIESLKKARSMIDAKSVRENWLKRRKYDELRILSGLKPLTNLRFSKYNTAQQRQTIWRLVNKRNYFQVEGEPFTLYYDGETRRTRYEDRLAKRHRLKFLPADNDDELINNDITENDDYGRA